MGPSGRLGSGVEKHKGSIWKENPKGAAPKANGARSEDPKPNVAFPRRKPPSLQDSAPPSLLLREACSGSPTPSCLCPTTSLTVLPSKCARSPSPHGPHSPVLGLPPSRVKGKLFPTLAKKARRVIPVEAELNSRYGGSNGGFIAKGEGETKRNLVLVWKVWKRGRVLGDN